MDSNIRTLFMAVIIEVIGFGILIPIVPLLFTVPDSSFFILSSGTAVNRGYILLGFLVGVYPLAQFVATPILGQLSDRYGRKRIIQICAFGTAVSSLVFAYGIVEESLILLFGSRIFNGLTGGLIAAAQASIADISDRDSKSKNFGIIGAAFGVGFIFGPFLGGLLSSKTVLPFFDVTTPFIAAAALSILSIALVQFSLKETAPMKIGDALNWKKPIEDVFEAYRRSELRSLFGANYMYFTGFSFFTSFVSVYLIEAFSLSQLDVGNYFFYVGLMIILGQGIIVPRFFSRFDEERSIAPTLAATGLFIVLLTVPQSYLVALAVTGFFAVFNALTQVSLQTSVSNRAADDEQGLILGINQSLRSLGSAFPAMIAGFTASLATSALPLVVGGSILMVSAAGFWVLRR